MEEADNLQQSSVALLSPRAMINDHHPQLVQVESQGTASGCQFSGVCHVTEARIATLLATLVSLVPLS